MAKRKQDSGIPSQTTVPQAERYQREGEEISTTTRPRNYPHGLASGSFNQPQPGALEGDRTEFMHNSHTNGKE